jgi:serine/threonine-protein kinase
MTEQPGTAGPGPVPNDRLDLTGTILAGRYRIVRRLGQGGMGAVWVGEHLRIGRLDAIKVLRGGLAEDADSLARFERGARNLSAIRHPNVCTLYDYGETEDGSPFLAIELIHGESLKELLDREGPLGAARAVAIARQIASALQAAHDAGIVHRDLKPANVMLERGADGADVAKVVDFDIAKGPGAQSGEEVTRLGFVVGTPEYMSPEQLMGDALDGRSDIYSLGLVLFRMLTGSLPFRGGSTHEVMVQRLTTPPLRIEEVSAAARNVPGLQAALDRALAVQREHRYARAADLAADLDRVLAGTAPAAAPSPAPAPAPRPPAAAPSAVPETVFSPAAAPARKPQVAPRRAASGRWLMAVAAVVVVGAGAAWLALGRGGTRTEAEPGGAGPITVALDSGRAGSTRTPADSPEAVRTEPQATGRASRGSPVEPTPDPGRDPGRATEVKPAIVIAAADIEDTLFRLLDRLGERDDARSAAAVRDTANAVYSQAGASSGDRALAAYVTANAFLTLRDGGECERWARRAIQLNPDHRGAATLLTNPACRSVRP